MKYTLNLSQTGDTIIEVLIVLAILSLSFGISYATASRGLDQSRNSEEHSEALGVIDAQIEELRGAITSNLASFPPSSTFCMTGSSTFDNAFSGDPQSETDIVDSQSGYKYYPTDKGCLEQGRYNISIDSVGASSVTPAISPESSFTIMARWDGLGNLGPQQESMTYRIGALDVADGGIVGITGGGSSPTISSITIDGGTATTCATGAYACFSNGSTGYVSGCWSNLDAYYDTSGLITNLTSPATSYQLTINYSNDIPDCSNLPNPPSSYYFNVNVYLNNSPTPTLSNVQLQASSGSDPLTLNVTTPPTSIKIEWTNDVDNGAYDANFELNSMVLTAE